MNLSWSHGINKMCDRCSFFFYFLLFCSIHDVTNVQICFAFIEYDVSILPFAKTCFFAFIFYSVYTIIVPLEPTCICTFELYRFFHFLHSSLNFVCSFDQKSQQKPKLNIGYHPKDIQCSFFASNSKFLPFRICVLDISNKMVAFCNLNLSSSAVFDNMSQALDTTESFFLSMLKFA